MSLSATPAGYKERCAGRTQALRDLSTGARRLADESELMEELKRVVSGRLKRSMPSALRSQPSMEKVVQDDLHMSPDWPDYDVDGDIRTEDHVQATIHDAASPDWL